MHAVFVTLRAKIAQQLDSNMYLDWPTLYYSNRKIDFENGFPSCAHILPQQPQL